MPGTRDLSGTPSLVDADIANDIRNLPTAVTVARCNRASKCLGSVDAAAVGGHTTRNANTDRKSNKAANVNALADNLGHAASFAGQRGRPAVAELCRIAKYFLAAVASIGVRLEAQVSDRCLRKEVKERLCATEGEARPLDEGAVRVKLVGGTIETDRVGAQTNGDVAAHRAIFGLIPGISRNVTANTPPVVAGKVVVHIIDL